MPGARRMELAEFCQRFARDVEKSAELFDDAFWIGARQGGLPVGKSTLFIEDVERPGHVQGTQIGVDLGKRVAIVVVAKEGVLGEVVDDAAEVLVTERLDGHVKREELLVGPVAPRRGRRGKRFTNRHTGVDAQDRVNIPSARGSEFDELTALRARVRGACR